MKFIVVGITGKAGTGKDTFAKCLWMEFGKYPKTHAAFFALANPIKKIAKEIFGWDGAKDKKGRKLLQILGTEAGRDYDPGIWLDKLDISFKEYVQDAPETLENVVALVTDVRFGKIPNSYDPESNEATYIKTGKYRQKNSAKMARVIGKCEWNGVLIKVIGPERIGDKKVELLNDEAKNHASERFIDNMSVDIEIDNSGSLEQLQEKAKQTVSSILDTYIKS